MRNNPVFLRVLKYVDNNNLSKAQIMAASDDQILRVMFPPDGVRPKGDFTVLASVKKALRHVYRERLREARVAAIIKRLQVEYPAVNVSAVGDGQYLVTIGDGDE